MGDQIKEGDCDWNDKYDLWRYLMDDNSLVCYDVEKGEGSGVMCQKDGFK